MLKVAVFGQLSEWLPILIQEIMQLCPLKAETDDLHKDLSKLTTGMGEFQSFAAAPGGLLNVSTADGRAAPT